MDICHLNKKMNFNQINVHIINVVHTRSFLIWHETIIIYSGTNFPVTFHSRLNRSVDGKVVKRNVVQLFSL